MMLHPSWVAQHQSASSCCACRSVVVRRTRRRRKSCPFVGCPLAPLLNMVTTVALSILGGTSHHLWLITLAVTTDLHSTCPLDFLLASPHCVRCTADWMDFRNVRSPPELAPGSGCRVAPRLRLRLLLRPARSAFIALKHAHADHRELQQLLLEDLVVDSSVRQLSLLCRFAHSSVFSFHPSSCCLSCCIQQSTRVPRSRLAKRCPSVSADRRQEGKLFLRSSRSF